MGEATLKAMLLAAGFGRRMGNLTKKIPKPLLEIEGKPLIQHHIERLSRCGIKEFIVNLHYLGEKIQNYLGDGSKFGVSIHYSPEDPILGMGGGVQHALPLLGDEPFIVLSNDVWTDFPFERLIQSIESAAHLVLVDNPVFHLAGDYSLNGNYVTEKTDHTFNYAGFGVFSPEIFRDHPPGHFGIVPILKSYIAQERVTGEHYAGLWLNINTPEDLAVVREI